jgi:hypothetical protein
MAPEQARGETGRAGPTADVFALGAVLYFLLTGHAPFVGRDTAEVWDRARRGDFDRAALGKPGVPRRLARVTLRAMALDPEARYPSAEALAADLGAFLRRPRLVAAQAGVLLLAATAAGAWALRPRPAGDAGRAAPVPLKVESFQGELHRRPTKTNLGSVGVSAFAGRFQDDDVRVRARLSVPGYCYLISLNPDGRVQPCSPEDPGAAPPRSDEVHFPADPKIGFGLTDGVGLQAFVLVVSREPLPPLAGWLSDAGALPWAKTEAAGVWRYDGHAFESDAERGGLRPLSDLPRPLVAACRALQSRPGVGAIRALAFPVQPRPETDGPAAPGPGVSSPAESDGSDRIIVARPQDVLSALRISARPRVVGFVRGIRVPLGGPGRPLAEPALPERRGTELVLGSFGDGRVAVRSPPQTSRTP